MSFWDNLSIPKLGFFLVFGVLGFCAVGVVILSIDIGRLWGWQTGVDTIMMLAGAYFVGKFICTFVVERLSDTFLEEGSHQTPYMTYDDETGF